MCTLAYATYFAWHNSSSRCELSMQVSETFDRYILWKHSYKVTVNPGYDHAFLLCLVIIMEVYNPRHKHSFGSPQIAEGPREHSSSAKSGEPHMSKTAENQNATGVAASKPL